MLRHTIIQYLNCAPDSAYNCIADFKRYGDIHPYMIEVKEISGADGKAKYYAVKERLKLYGFIPMRPAYNVKVIEIEKGKQVQYYSDVVTGVHLTINFRFTCDAATGCVTITEELELDAPIIIRTVFLHILKTAHAVFYSKLKDRLG